MKFKFTLDNDIEGSQVLEKNPQGWDTMQILIQRGLDTHGFFYEQTVNLKFFCNGAGKEYIDNIRTTQGIDAQIRIDISVSCEDCDDGADAPDYSDDYSDDYGSKTDATCNYESFYEGILDMKTYNSDDVITSVNIIQSGILQKVRNRLDTKVDLLSTSTIDGTTLDPNDILGTTTLHSKVIRQQAELEYSEPFGEDTSPVGWTQLGENDDSYNIPFNISESTRTIEHSFSATLVPDSAVLNEIPGYNGEVLNSLERSDTYPGDSNQIQDLNMYEFFTTVDNLYTINGKIRFGINAFIQFTGSNLVGTPTLDFVQDIFNLTFYLKAGGNIIYSEVMADVFNVQSINVDVTGLKEILLPFQEYTTEFSIPDVELGFEDTIQAYVKFDSHKVFDRPGAPGGLYSCDVNFFSYVNKVFDVDNPSFISLVSNSTTSETTPYSIKVFEVGKRISQVISDQEDCFKSDYFGRTDSDPSYLSNGCGSLRAIIPGFWVRGFPITGSNSRTLRMSMNEYFQGLNCIDNLGLGIEQIGEDFFVVINGKEYFYDSSTVLMTFNNVPDLNIAEAPEYYFPRITIGYDKWTTEFTNGLDEPNSKRQYDTGIKAVDNQLNLISNFVAGGYRLESARRMQYIDSATEDTEFDEDNFIVCLDPTDITKAEKDGEFDQVNNLISPETSYNLRILPERNYLRWNSVINAGLTKYPGRNARLMSGEGNFRVTSEFTDDNCPGNWNNNLFDASNGIQWDDADNTDKNPLWLPEIATFKFPISFTQFKTIKANPKGVIMISRTDEDHVPYYILSVQYTPANGGLSDFKLLRAFVE